MTLETLTISPDFALGAICGGFATLATWQFSTSYAKLNELIGKFEEQRWHKDD